MLESVSTFPPSSPSSRVSPFFNPSFICFVLISNKTSSLLMPSGNGNTMVTLSFSWVHVYSFFLFVWLPFFAAADVTSSKFCATQSAKYSCLCVTTRYCNSHVSLHLCLLVNNLVKLQTQHVNLTFQVGVYQGD